MKSKIRKPPEMPYWFWLDNDNCWKCKNRNGCSGVVILKRKEKEFLGIKEKMSWMIGRRGLDGRKESQRSDSMDGK